MIFDHLDTMTDVNIPREILQYKSKDAENQGDLEKKGMSV
jgi:hypothetical protein